MKKVEKIDLEKQKLAYNEEKYTERQKLEQEIEKNANMLIQHQKLLKITSFTGYFEFLHNNFLTPVYYDGSLYSSVTHAYHAARSNDDTTRNAILNADSFHTVANISSRIQDPEDWPNRRLNIMERLVRDKFRRSKELQEKLKATDKRELQMSYEDEKKGNLFWGMVNGKGQNQLGRIIMKIRDDVVNNREILNWITTNFDLVTDLNLLPEISLTVTKNNNKIDHLILKNKLFYKIGQLPDSDLILAHPSVSRLHAIILCDRNLGIILVDLRSKSGTKLDDVLIHDHIPYRLKDGKKINFAMSTRDYVVNIDLTKIKKVYEREKIKIEDEKDFLIKMEKSKTDGKLMEEVINKTFGLNKDDSDVVFVGRIPQIATEDNLKKIFEDQFGKIKNLEWPNYRDTGLKKPFAFIQFVEKDAAKQAVEYGIISYDVEEDEENEYEQDNEVNLKQKNFMLKIKYADEDKFKPNFRMSSNKEWKRKHSVEKEELVKENKTSGDDADEDYRDKRDTRDHRYSRENRDSRDYKDRRDYKESRDNRDNRDYKDNTENRVIREKRESRGNRDNKDNRDNRDKRDERDNRYDRHDRDRRDNRDDRDHQAIPGKRHEIRRSRENDTKRRERNDKNYKHQSRKKQESSSSDSSSSDSSSDYYSNSNSDGKKSSDSSDSSSSDSSSTRKEINSKEEKVLNSKRNRS